MEPAHSGKAPIVRIGVCEGDLLCWEGYWLPCRVPFI